MSRNTPRSRFLSYLRDPSGHRPPVSPFLPKPDVIEATLRHLALPLPRDPGGAYDPVAGEVALAEALDYEPMFMVGCTQFIFPWALDPERSDPETATYAIDTGAGRWEKRVPRAHGLGSTAGSFPVQTEEDHRCFQAACADTAGRLDQARAFFRDWRRRAGEGGVIVIGHVNPYWLAHQIGQADIFLHYSSFPDTYRRSMDAVYQASLALFAVGLEEGFDFMSASGLGLEMTSPHLFEEMDLPYLRAYADWTHGRGGLFWYHNCGQTRKLIDGGAFGRIEADVIETLAPPPTGDNDLADARRRLATRTCTKGNLDLDLLRDGTAAQVAAATRAVVAAVAGRPHIYSTADAVLPGTPPENLIAHVRTARQLTA
ncbi:MAG: uroporphyrinogen decarboxylase family protein [Gemmatimonadota bacterium]